MSRSSKHNKIYFNQLDEEIENINDEEEEDRSYSRHIPIRFPPLQLFASRSGVGGRRNNNSNNNRVPRSLEESKKEAEYKQKQLEYNSSLPSKQEQIELLKKFYAKSNYNNHGRILNVNRSFQFNSNLNNPYAKQMLRGFQQQGYYDPSDSDPSDSADLINKTNNNSIKRQMNYETNMNMNMNMNMNCNIQDKINEMDYINYNIQDPIENNESIKEIEYNYDYDYENDKEFPNINNTDNDNEEEQEKAILMEKEKETKEEKKTESDKDNNNNSYPNSDTNLNSKSNRLINKEINEKKPRLVDNSNSADGLHKIKWSRLFFRFLHKTKYVYLNGIVRVDVESCDINFVLVGILNAIKARVELNQLKFVLSIRPNDMKIIHSNMNGKK